MNNFNFILLLILTTGCSNSNIKWYSNEYTNNEIQQILYKCERDAKFATSSNQFSSTNKRWAIIGAIISTNEENSLFDKCIASYNLSTEKPLTGISQFQKSKNTSIPTNNESEYTKLIVGTWSEKTNKFSDKTTFFPNYLFSEVVHLGLPNGKIKTIVFGGKWKITNNLLIIEFLSTTEEKLIPRGFKISMKILKINHTELHIKDYMQNKIIILYRLL